MPLHLGKQWRAEEGKPEQCRGNTGPRETRGLSQRPVGGGQWGCFSGHAQTLGFVLFYFFPSVQSSGSVVSGSLPSQHLILCRPLLLLPSIFSSIRVFSNESVLHIRWPKYWSFCFSISPSNEYCFLTKLLIYFLNLILSHQRRLSESSNFELPTKHVDVERAPLSVISLLVNGIPHSHPSWTPVSSVVPISTNTLFCPGSKSSFSLFPQELSDG